MTEKKERYNSYSSYLKKVFSTRIQKISVNAGFTCPNRDGRVGYGGCTYCNNQTFNPDYCKTDKSVSQQISEGIKFFRKKYDNQKYLAYFQAYTNTYSSLEILKEKYEEALACDDVVGIVIGTRPDCMPDDLLEYLSHLSKEYYVMIEYGVESTCDDTLKLINRGHNYKTAIDSISKTAECGIDTCAHLILGLPCEDRNLILSHADRISELPVKTLKLHQLQLISGTKMAEQYKSNPEWFNLYNINDYLLLLCEFVERLRPDIVIERFISQSPKNLLIAPDWGIKNYEFTAKLEKIFEKNDVQQGRLYSKLC